LECRIRKRVDGLHEMNEGETPDIHTENHRVRGTFGEPYKCRHKYECKPIPCLLKKPISTHIAACYYNLKL
jgi:hypothetical protein